MSYFLKETAKFEEEIKSTLCPKCNEKHLVPVLGTKGLVGMCPTCDFISSLEKGGKMKGLIEGRIVHYVIESNMANLKAGEHCPAIIVKVWSQETGCINLQVFSSGGMMLKTSRLYSEDKMLGTWHWIEKA